MDTSAKVILFIEQFWSFFAVALAVALGGEATKRVVSLFVPTERLIWKAESSGSAADIAVDPALPFWYRLWRATISVHPVLVGGLIGFAPIPAANWVPSGYLAHGLWFALAGALSGQVFEIGKRLTEIIPAVVRHRLGMKSERPPPPAAPPEPKALAEELEPEVDEEEDKGKIP